MVHPFCKVGLLCLSLFSLGACKTVGSSFKDFTAFFNRYYNARADFERVERNMQKSVTAINRDEYLPLFQSSSSDRATFDKIVKRSADLIRAHPESRWADDAVMLIAKSYYYQEAFLGAEQKFRELIIGGGRLENEARFWLVRTLIAAEAFGRAQDEINIALENDQLETQWRGMLLLAAGELKLRQADWQGAADNLTKALPGVEDNNLRIKGNFLLGQVHETLGNYAEAIKCFRNVQNAKPAFTLSYAALISEVENLGKAGENVQALRLVNKMMRDDKYYDLKAEVAFTQALLLANTNREDDAFLKLDRLLYDPKENAGQFKGRIHYLLGELYTNKYRNFSKAAAHYDTAATNLRTNMFANNSLKKTPHAILDASEKATAFKSFAGTFKKIFEADSLLALGALDEEAFKLAIDNITAIKTKEALALKAKNEQLISQNRFLGIEGSGQAGYNPRRPEGEQFDTGFLNHLNTTMVQDAQNNFKQRWGNARPLAPNWRRIDAVRNVVTTDTTANVNTNNPRNGINLTELGVKIDTERVPRTPEKQAKMALERNAMMYDLGNTLFLSMAMPDSALVWYRKVIDRSPESEVANRAYFALAEIQLAKKDTTAAHRIYQRIIENSPETDFADKARERLGMASASEVIRDSTILAQNAYNLAYTHWQKGEHETAIGKFLAIPVQFKKTPSANQALFAAAETMLEWVKQTEKDWFEPLPVQPDSLLSKGKIWTVEEIYEYLKSKDAQGAYGKAAIEKLAALKDLRAAANPQPIPENSKPIVPTQDAPIPTAPVQTNPTEEILIPVEEPTPDIPPKKDDE